MNNEEKILEMLAQIQAAQAEQGAQLAAQGAQLATQGAQLAAQGDRLSRVETLLENKVIPDIKALAEGQTLLQETLARKDSMEEIKDALTEWEIANKASYSEMWNRISRLEKAK